jgi:hypothetical protein
MTSSLSGMRSNQLSYEPLRQERYRHFAHRAYKPRGRQSQMHRVRGARRSPPRASIAGRELLILSPGMRVSREPAPKRGIDGRRGMAQTSDELYVLIIKDVTSITRRMAEMRPIRCAASGRAWPRDEACAACVIVFDTRHPLLQHAVGSSDGVRRDCHTRAPRPARPGRTAVFPGRRSQPRVLANRER